MKCCVYTRFVYETPYIDSFIEHYLKMGFDKIIILFHDHIRYDLDESLLEYVEIMSVPNNGNKLLNEYRHLIPEDYDWVLSVDADEFLLLHHSYPTIQDYVISKLKEDENINMFQFTWGWLHTFKMEKEERTLQEILSQYKIFEGSKDKKMKDLWVKSMTKISDIEYITCHNCILKGPAVICVDRRIKYYGSSEDFYENQKSSSEEEEEDSDDDEQEKEVNLLPRGYSWKDHTYSECVLVHINSRSLMNAIIKGLNIHVTQVKRKRIKDLKRLKKFINSFDLNAPIYQETMDKFIKCIGYKLKFPILCLEKEEINERIKHCKLRTNTVKFANNAYLKDHEDYHMTVLQERMRELYCVLDMDKFMKIIQAFSLILDNTFRTVF